MNTNNHFIHIKTLGELKKSSYRSRSIKDEIRENLILQIKQKQKTFEGIFGYDDTVIIDLERALLSRHNILLLGLRGQAKTKIARSIFQFLDNYTPVLEISEINEDPLNPILEASKQHINQHGDNTAIRWIRSEERVVEKLATPDVSVADLIGDYDPIKAMNNQWSYADERAIHFGLVPRSNRSIFVLNELPDLQPRIQVSLLNILQEGDIQIRGYKFRLPLDVLFIFTANPEDYTNRGNIITPLKDRIDSQIITHYPSELDISKKITQHEIKVLNEVREKVIIPKYLNNIIERISIAARDSQYIDDQSGVSARLSISAMENLYSAVERRLIISDIKTGRGRIMDLIGVIPAITGKVELVYEGEQEGIYNVAISLIGEAIKAEFLAVFPDPESKLNKEEEKTYNLIKSHFSNGNILELFYDAADVDLTGIYKRVPGLYAFAATRTKNKLEIDILCELILYGMAELHMISREILDHKVSFNDDLANLMDNIFE